MLSHLPASIHSTVRLYHYPGKGKGNNEPLTVRYVYGSLPLHLPGYGHTGKV